MWKLNLSENLIPDNLISKKKKKKRKEKGKRNYDLKG